MSLNDLIHRVAIVLLVALSFIQEPPRLVAAEEAVPATTPTFVDVRYAPKDRNLLDFYQAKSSRPTPVLIWFHGGGWIMGDKAEFDPRPYLDAGISVVSANYRFISGTPDAAPFPAPMSDGARVVQYVRSNAREWNIDPSRIALSGVSAGGVICMWIGFQDDLANPDSDDPVERFSTRVTCLLPEASPTTLDPELIGRRVGRSRSADRFLFSLFDISSLEDLQLPHKRELMLHASPITHVSSDDPPTYLLYHTRLDDTPLPEDVPFMVFVHHAEFGRIIQEKLDEAGVSNVLQFKGDGRPRDAGLKFLTTHLLPEAPQLAP